MYTPHLFISIGATGAMFTLRETYLHEFYVGARRHTEVRSFHHYNLGQDPLEAMFKAKEASERLGLQLTTTSEELDANLRDIKRTGAAEMAERRRIEEERLRQWELDRLARQQENINLIWSERKFINGPYRDQPLDSCRDYGYINWLVSKVDEFQDTSYVKQYALIFKEMIAKGELELLPEPSKTAHLGQPGDKFQADVTVVRATSFQSQGFGSYYSSTCYVITMVTSTGECLVSMSERFRANVGDKMTIKGTVKAHDEYKGQAQTRVMRLKIV